MKIPVQYPINRRILVIDDNPDIHEDFRKILAPPARQEAAMVEAEATLFGSAGGIRREAGFAVDDAFQGEEGLRLVEQACDAGRPYAVAFVDMRMPPGWDGLETIARLWTADTALQIVICTAYSDYSWQEIVTRLGASDRLLIVKKPFEAMEIIQLAWALTEKCSLAREVARQVDHLEAAVQERTRALSVANLRMIESINELQASAEDRRRSEERFRSVIDTAHAAIAIVDANGDIDLWNPGATRLFGWPADEAAGRPLTIALTDLTDDGLARLLERAVVAEDAAQNSVGLTGRTRDGRTFPLALSLAPWTSAAGTCFTCLFEDLGRRQPG